MRIVSFPKAGDGGERHDFVAQLDAALYGGSGGSDAEAWRELRDDVRALAMPMSPQFEAALHERIQERATANSRRARRRPDLRGALAGARAWLGSGLGPRLVALGGICAMAAIVVLAVAAPWRSVPLASKTFSQRAAVSKSGRVVQQDAPFSSSTSGEASSSKAQATSGEVLSAGGGTVTQEASVTPQAATSTSRVQQRAATLTLAPKPAEVQSVADQIAQLAARDGGFVQNSQVRLQHGTGGEANLQLSLPSARLSAALAQLAQLAPTRAQSQSLQDITDVYAAARTKLSDAVAARQALLRALAKATTQGEIESLHARLSLASAAITRTRTAFAAVARHGGNSTVEVSVLGDTHAGGERSTLSKALHDAGDVLKVALAVLIVALAVLVPLALLGILAALVWRTSRRRLRERALS